jgi:uncharacterized protein YecA (UPF0149 family)
MRKRAAVFDELAALNYTWCQNAEMDDMAWRLRKPGSMANIGKGRGKKKVGRNDPCPCGSGQKYKECCLKSIVVGVVRQS